MTVTWDPDPAKPADAAEIEAEIGDVAGNAEVKLTLRGGAWRVRALAPASLCTRGPGFAGRDLSGAIAEILRAHDHPARA